MTIGYCVTWDESPSSGIDGLYVNRVERGMTGAVRDVRVDMPGRDGAWLFTENRGLRAITAELTRVRGAGQGLREMMVEIADWVDKTGERRLEFDDQPDRYWLASLVQAPSSDEWRNLGRTSIEWAAQPYAFAVALTEECASATNGGSHSWTPDDSIFAYPEVVITFDGGAASGVTLEMNGDTLVVADTVVPDGVPLTISSVSDTVIVAASTDTELTGVFDPETLSMAGVSGDFPVIVSGLNSWTVTWVGSATSATVCVRWRRRYR